MKLFNETKKSIILSCLLSFTFAFVSPIAFSSSDDSSSDEDQVTLVEAQGGAEAGGHLAQGPRIDSPVIGRAFIQRLIQNLGVSLHTYFQDDRIDLETIIDLMGQARVVHDLASSQNIAFQREMEARIDHARKQLALRVAQALRAPLIRMLGPSSQRVEVSLILENPSLINFLESFDSELDRVLPHLLATALVRSSDSMIHAMNHAMAQATNCVAERGGAALGRVVLREAGKRGVKEAVKCIPGVRAGLEVERTAKAMEDTMDPRVRLCVDDGKKDPSLAVKFRKHKTCCGCGGRTLKKIANGTATACVKVLDQTPVCRAIGSTAIKGASGLGRWGLRSVIKHDIQTKAYEISKTPLRLASRALELLTREIKELETRNSDARGSFLAREQEKSEALSDQKRTLEARIQGLESELKQQKEDLTRRHKATKTRLKKEYDAAWAQTPKRFLGRNTEVHKRVIAFHKALKKEFKDDKARELKDLEHRQRPNKEELLAMKHELRQINSSIRKTKKNLNWSRNVRLVNRSCALAARGLEHFTGESVSGRLGKSCGERVARLLPQAQFQKSRCKSFQGRVVKGIRGAFRKGAQLVRWGMKNPAKATVGGLICIGGGIYLAPSMACSLALKAAWVVVPTVGAPLCEYGIRKTVGHCQKKPRDHED